MTKQRISWIITIVASIILLLMISIFFIATQTLGHREKIAHYMIQKAPQLNVTILTGRPEPTAPISLRPDKADIKIEFKVDYPERNRQPVPTYEVVFTEIIK